MLLFYWSIGHDISENYNEIKYGKSFFKNLSLDLQDALPDVKSFSCLDFCKKAIAKGGLVPTAVNAANEVAVALFLQDKIGFLDIENIAREAYENQKVIEYNSVEEVIEADKAARESVKLKYN